MRPTALAFVLLFALTAAPAFAQASAAEAPPSSAASAASADSSAASTPVAGTTSFLVENLSRVEVWRYFQPRPGAAVEPDYAFVGNRSSLGAAYEGPRWAFQGTLQYVRLENLPSKAIGPGLLGTGAAYYFQAAGEFSYQFYLRGLSLTWRDRPRGLWVEVGRLSRAASTQPTSGDATIDRVVRDELQGRLLGDMEWSFYERAWDGVRGGVAKSGRSATVTLALPTQGTYEESANLFMDRVPVAAIELAAQPGALVRHTRVDAFAIRYDDTRRISARPDNTGRPTARADITVVAVGGSIAGAYPSRAGTTDVALWAAAQGGHWYEQSHRGRAATASVGQRATRVAGQPWLRAGVAWASGDGNATDDRHDTFFPMLPSGDRVSSLNAYALMNVRDAWTRLQVTPHRAVDLAASAHQVRLADAADRWYQGSGATIRAGNYFGYQGRNARGATTIGTVLDAQVTWRPWRWWTVRALAGRILGGDVQATLFAGTRLTTGWIESTLHF